MAGVGQTINIKALKKEEETGGTSVVLEAVDAVQPKSLSRAMTAKPNMLTFFSAAPRKEAGSGALDPVAASPSSGGVKRSGVTASPSSEGGQWPRNGGGTNSAGEVDDDAVEGDEGAASKRPRTEPASQSTLPRASSVKAGDGGIKSVGNPKSRPAAPKRTGKGLSQLKSPPNAVKTDFFAAARPRPVPAIAVTAAQPHELHLQHCCAQHN